MAVPRGSNADQKWQGLINRLPVVVRILENPGTERKVPAPFIESLKKLHDQAQGLLEGYINVTVPATIDEGTRKEIDECLGGITRCLDKFPLHLLLEASQPKWVKASSGTPPEKLERASSLPVNVLVSPTGTTGPTTKSEGQTELPVSIPERGVQETGWQAPQKEGNGLRPKYSETGVTGLTTEEVHVVPEGMPGQLDGRRACAQGSFGGLGVASKPGSDPGTPREEFGFEGAGGWTTILSRDIRPELAYVELDLLKENDERRAALQHAEREQEKTAKVQRAREARQLYANMDTGFGRMDIQNEALQSKSLDGGVIAMRAPQQGAARKEDVGDLAEAPREGNSGGSVASLNVHSSRGADADVESQGGRRKRDADHIRANPTAGSTRVTLGNSTVIPGSNRVTAGHPEIDVPDLQLGLGLGSSFPEGGKPTVKQPLWCHLGIRDGADGERQNGGELSGRPPSPKFPLGSRPHRAPFKESGTHRGLKIARHMQRSESLAEERTTAGEQKESRDTTPSPPESYVATFRGPTTMSSGLGQLQINTSGETLGEARAGRSNKRSGDALEDDREACATSPTRVHRSYQAPQREACVKRPRMESFYDYAYPPQAFYGGKSVSGVSLEVNVGIETPPLGQWAPHQPKYPYSEIDPESVAFAPHFKTDSKASPYPKFSLDPTLYPFGAVPFVKAPPAYGAHATEWAAPFFAPGFDPHAKMPPKFGGVPMAPWLDMVGRWHVPEELAGDGGKTQSWPNVVPAHPLQNIQARPKSAPMPFAALPEEHFYDSQSEPLQSLIRPPPISRRPEGAAFVKPTPHSGGGLDLNEPPPLSSGGHFEQPRQPHVTRKGFVPPPAVYPMLAPTPSLPAFPLHEPPIARPGNFVLPPSVKAPFIPPPFPCVPSESLPFSDVHNPPCPLSGGAFLPPPFEFAPPWHSEGHKYAAPPAVQKLPYPPPPQLMSPIAYDFRRMAYDPQLLGMHNRTPLEPQNLGFFPVNWAAETRIKRVESPPDQQEWPTSPDGFGRRGRPGRHYMAVERKAELARLEKERLRSGLEDAQHPMAAPHVVPPPFASYPTWDLRASPMLPFGRLQGLACESSVASNVVKDIDERDLAQADEGRVSIRTAPLDEAATLVGLQRSSRGTAKVSRAGEEPRRLSHMHEQFLRGVKEGERAQQSRGWQLGRPPSSQSLGVGDPHMRVVPKMPGAFGSRSPPMKGGGNGRGSDEPDRKRRNSGDEVMSQHSGELEDEQPRKRRSPSRPYSVHDPEHLGLEL